MESLCREIGITVKHYTDDQLQTQQKNGSEDTRGNDYQYQLWSTRGRGFIEQVQDYLVRSQYPSLQFSNDGSGPTAGSTTAGSMTTGGALGKENSIERWERRDKSSSLTANTQSSVSSGPITHFKLEKSRANAMSRPHASHTHKPTVLLVHDPFRLNSTNHHTASDSSSNNAMCAMFWGTLLGREHKAGYTARGASSVVDSSRDSDISAMPVVLVVSGADYTSKLEDLHLIRQYIPAEYLPLVQVTTLFIPPTTPLQLEKILTKVSHQYARETKHTKSRTDARVGVEIGHVIDTDSFASRMRKRKPSADISTTIAKTGGVSTADMSCISDIALDCNGDLRHAVIQLQWYLCTRHPTATTTTTTATTTSSTASSVPTNSTGVRVLGREEHIGRRKVVVLLDSSSEDEDESFKPISTTTKAEASGTHQHAPNPTPTPIPGSSASSHYVNRDDNSYVSPLLAIGKLLHLKLGKLTIYSSAVHNPF